MLSAYEKAVSLGLTTATFPGSDPPREYTDEEIVEELLALKVTRSMIKTDELKFLMRERALLVKLAYEDPTTGMKWNGTIVNMINALKSGTSDPDPIIAGSYMESLVEVNRWFSHITDPDSKNFDTTNPTIGGDLAKMATQFGGQASMPSVADFTAVVALGGGWVYGDLTVGIFQQLRVDAEAAAIAAAEVAAEEEAALLLLTERAGFHERFDAMLNQFSTTEQPLGAASLRVMADEWEIV
jgi:hypothetical protein